MRGFLMDFDGFHHTQKARDIQTLFFLRWFAIFTHSGFMRIFTLLLVTCPASPSSTFHGAVAQLGERFVRNEEVVGSIPISSTMAAVEQRS
jgi:hypothetical protein